METRKPGKRDIGKTFYFVRIKDERGRSVDVAPFIATYQGRVDGMRPGWYIASGRTYHSRMVQIKVN
jgi:hypothetical protein